VVAACAEHDLSLHIDGARLFNAAVARGVSPAHWAARASSVQVCFSKGLGCAFGAVLATQRRHEARVRRIKQRLGGALRQAGLLAGGMLYALDHHVERLAEDHRRATRLAEALQGIDALEVTPPDTNLVYLRCRQGSAAEAADRLRGQGVLVSHMPPDRLRACLHLGISDADVEQAIVGFSRAFSKA
jgi:threonine aldolase